VDNVKIRLDEVSDVAFAVKVSGVTPGESATVRLVCEVDDMELVFKGTCQDKGIVEFTIPVLENRINEGTYSSRLEVIVGSKIFYPLKFQTTFAREIKVVAEALTQPSLKSAEISVIAHSIQQPPKLTPVKREILVPKQAKSTSTSANEMDALRRSLREFIGK
jgi:hypothetical protein